MPPPSWSEMTRVFGRIGLLSFGGPAAQIALMHRELVETRPWLGEETFLRGLGFCTLLPGPEAMQLATFAGWRLRGTAGGLLAGLLFVLPGAAVMIALAALYLAYGRLPLVEAAFLGVKAAALAIVAGALWRLREKALQGPLPLTVAVLAFVALFFLGLPFWAVLLAALVLGASLGTRGGTAPPPPPEPARTLRTVALWLAIWWAPLLALLLLAPGSTPAEAGLFFSWLATVSFGGAYAVLAALAQTAVETHGWLTPPQMVDGLGLAETTPGPLILVTVFTGWLGGAQVGPATAFATATVTLWATFVPCFLWIFAGAPHLERLTAHPRLRGAFDMVSAAVAGVIANLSLWFALHVLFASTASGTPPWPVLSSVNVDALALAVFAFAWLLGLKRGLLETLALSALAGALLSLI
ncbi:chromate efflux transporter [Jannaschia marina]|uniref:chromate efflux transporter n=1 Tax=Jannaschia marina TaxID=2741674 RepID=UPI0015CC02CD|nr:chromate efflux transporter [Jannaschia marina]